MTHAPSDPASLRLARSIVRRAYYDVLALPQGDASVRCVATDLNDICIDATVELDAIQPRLNLGYAA